MCRVSLEQLRRGEREPTLCLLIGAMKCGTTSLFEYLVQHPQIVGAAIKEPNFFIPELGPVQPLESYLGLWNYEPRRHRVLLEASTAYTKRPWVAGAPERIAALSLAPKFLYLLRDPIRRIESHHNFMRHKPGWDRRKLLARMIAYSDYYWQLEPYLAQFPPEQFYVLRLEDLVAEPATALERVCTFLGVDPLHGFDVSAVENVTPLRSTAEAGILGLMGAPVVSKLPKEVRLLGKQVLRPFGRTAWRMSASEAASIRKRLAPNMSRLRDVWGVDTESWGFR